MKKILFVLFVFLFIFIIYLANMDKKVYYLALGDSYDNDDNYSFYVKDYLNERGVLEKAVYEYADSSDRITDIYNRIISNEKSKDGTIKNSLIKADLVTLKINIDDVYEKIEDSSFIGVYDYMDDLTKDFDKLLNLIRKYSKEDIMFIGYTYKNDNVDEREKITYLNKRYKEVCDRYDVIFIKNPSSIIEKMDKYLFEG
ncbi:MAG: SGNH/GDSL hydrolase family protein [Bacilli bacterium]|nr:SGNH/GDSL hydrolase family protein [Bacilli bacterium]